MSLREKVINQFRVRRQKIIEGNVNSVPSPFKRFSNDFIGLEQGTYYIITSYTKGGKSQLCSYLLYKALMFEYYSKADLSIKILYFNLEETKEKVVTRFISWLLFDWTKGEYRLSPRELMSSKNDSPLDIKVLEIIETPEFTDIVDFFIDHIIFPEETNPTGIYKVCRQYAEANGEVFTKPSKYRDERGLHDVEVFDHYEANNPNEYVFAVVDTINIIDLERGFTKKQAIDKLSEYFVMLRNRYNMSPIVIQQQNTDNESVESVKYSRTRPSTSGLGDSKYTAHDANIVLGIYSPFKFGLKEYIGYPIEKFKDHFRTLEVLVNRDGELGGIVGLFFDGATCNWFELPKPDDTTNMGKVYAFLRRINNTVTPSLISIGKKYNHKLFSWKSIREFINRLHSRLKYPIFATFLERKRNKEEIKKN